MEKRPTMDVSLKKYKMIKRSNVRYSISLAAAAKINFPCRIITINTYLMGKPRAKMKKNPITNLVVLMLPLP